MTTSLRGVHISISPLSLPGTACHRYIPRPHNRRRFECGTKFCKDEKAEGHQCRFLQRRRAIVNCTKQISAVPHPLRSVFVSPVPRWPMQPSLTRLSTDANASWIGRVDVHPKKARCPTETFAGSEPLFMRTIKRVHSSTAHQPSRASVVLRQGGLCDQPSLPNDWKNDSSPSESARS